jgi:prepilin-type N-terminal cleavage/methylation domain-containing protein
MIPIMKNRGLSLPELLVALSIIAIVAAVVVPRFRDVRAKAQEAYLNENVRRMNSAFATWEAAGGVVGSNAKTSEILRMLGSEPGVALSLDSGTTDDTSDDIIDSSGSGVANSSRVRINLPSDIPLPSSPEAILVVGGKKLFFDPAQKAFVAISEPTFTRSSSQGGIGGWGTVAQEFIAADPEIVIRDGKLVAGKFGLISDPYSGMLIYGGSLSIPNLGNGVYRFSYDRTESRGNDRIVVPTSYINIDFAPLD